MAAKKVLSDLNLDGQSLIGARIYPLSTVAREALALELTTDDAGTLVWDLDLNNLFGWTGTIWKQSASAEGGGGGIAFLGGLAASADAPSSPQNGDLYVFTSSGTLNGTWNPVDTVSTGDQAIWDDVGGVWRYIQGNLVGASTAIAGIIQLATLSEVNAGTNSDKAVTPNTLSNWVPSNSLTARPSRRVTTFILNLLPETPVAVTHGLDLASKYDLIVQCWNGDERVGLAILPVNTNTIQVISNVSITNVYVVCEG